MTLRLDHWNTILRLNLQNEPQAGSLENDSQAEYIAAGSSCSQQGWLNLMLTEHNVTHDVMTLYYDKCGWRHST